MTKYEEYMLKMALIRTISNCVSALCAIWLVLYWTGA